MDLLRDMLLSELYREYIVILYSYNLIILLSVRKCRHVFSVSVPVCPCVSLCVLVCPSVSLCVFLPCLTVTVTVSDSVCDSVNIRVRLSINIIYICVTE